MATLASDVKFVLVGSSRASVCLYLPSSQNNYIFCRVHMDKILDIPKLTAQYSS